MIEFEQVVAAAAVPPPVAAVVVAAVVVVVAAAAAAAAAGCERMTARAWLEALDTSVTGSPSVPASNSRYQPD